MEYQRFINYKKIEFKELKDKVLTEIVVDQADDFIKFFTETDEYLMAHEQDCCESVCIKDICGPIQELIGSPIFLAEERTNHNENKEVCESCTWTFYEIANKNVSITIVWYGTSNGYYSESVDLYKKIKE